jgi:hypothetical protein
MSGSNVRVAMAHFCIGWKYLYFDGKREEARKHFQDCVDQNILRIDIHYWARAILKLLEDPTWPRWQGHK